MLERLFLRFADFFGQVVVRGGIHQVDLRDRAESLASVVSTRNGARQRSALLCCSPPRGTAGSKAMPAAAELPPR